MRACSSHSTFIPNSRAHGVIKSFSPKDKAYKVSTPHRFRARHNINPALKNKNGLSTVNRINHLNVTGGFASHARFTKNPRSLNSRNKIGQLPKKNASIPRLSSSSMRRSVCTSSPPKRDS